MLSKDPVFRGGYSMTYTQLGTGFFDGNYSGNPGPQPGRQPHARRSARRSWPVSDKHTRSCCATPAGCSRRRRRHRWSVSYPLTPAVTETLDIHYPDWPVPQTHQYSFGFQRELGKSMALDVRYVGNTNDGRLDQRGT